MKKILAIFGIFLLTIILGAVGFCFTLLNWPTLLVNQNTLRYASKYLPQYEFSWQNLQTTSVSHGLLNKTLTISFDRLCSVAKVLADDEHSTCFGAGVLSVHYNILDWKVVSLGPIQLKQGRVRYKASSKPKPKEEKEVNSPFRIPDLSFLKLPDFMKQTDFYPISVELEKVYYQKGPDFYEGRILLDAQLTEKRLDDVQVKIAVQNRSTRQNYELMLLLDSEDFFSSDAWLTYLDAKLQDPNKQIAAQLFWNRKAGRVRGEVEAGLNGKKMQGQIFADYDKDSFSGQLNASLPQLHKQIERVELKNCVINSQLTNEADNDGDLSLRCPVYVFLKAYSFTVQNKAVYRSPKQVIADVSGSFATFFRPDLSHPTKGTLKADLKASPEDIVRTKGTASAELEGIPQQFPRDWKVLSDMLLEVNVDQFERLTQLLSGTDFAVPAPFHVLRGKMNLQVRGKADLGQQSNTFPIEFSTQLTSEEQELSVKTDGEMQLRYNNVNFQESELKLDTVLQDVQIQLPNLNPVSFPQLKPDSRIKKRETKFTKPKASAFHYNITVKTAAEKPVLIKYYLAKKPIPLNIDLAINDRTGLSGKVSILAFPVSFFKRNAQVDFMNIDLASVPQASEIDGRVIVRYVDYTIYARLLGQLSKPRLILESFPPLSQEDIYAVLLYGEPYQSLGFDESASVGDVSAAVANRALSLFSMYALASTPIQSVGYDPVTQTFSAKVKLGKRTSLLLGGGEQKKELGLQKRFGKNWVIRTTYESETDADEKKNSSGTALIEWNKRY